LPYLPSERTVLLAVNPKDRLREYVPRSFMAGLRIRNLVATLAPELLVARLEHLPIALAVALYRSPVPYVLKTVERFWYLTAPLSRTDALLRRLQLGLSRRVVRGAIGFDSCTPELLERVRAYVPDCPPGVLVENAADLEAFRPGAGQRCFHGVDFGDTWPVLGFIGGFPSQRGTRQILEMMRRLAVDFPRIGAVVAGWDDDMPALREEIEAAGLGARVHLFGAIPYAEAPAFLATVDVGFAFDNATDLADIGTSAQKIRQYLACGVPVLASSFGNRFLAEQGLGELVHPDDAQAQEQALRRLLGRLLDADEDVAGRARAYAEQHLGHERATALRLDWWRSRLAGSRAAGYAAT
jgi:glycosyltransferase involved in cell wall biosynthesis